LLIELFATFAPHFFSPETKSRLRQPVLPFYTTKICTPGAEALDQKYFTPNRFYTPEAEAFYTRSPSMKNAGRLTSIGKPGVQNIIRLD